MTIPAALAADLGRFELISARIARSVLPDRRFPEWPFARSNGYPTVVEYDIALSQSFGPVVQALAQHYADEQVFLAGYEPAASYYKVFYDYCPAAEVDGESAGVQYSEALSWCPGGDPAGSLELTLNVFALSGSSGSWSLLGQRDWEIAILATSDADGPWLHLDVPWFPADVELDSIRAPAGWGMPLSEGDRAQFASMIRRHRLS